MAGVFISYRRSDVVGDADRLHERLISVFSEPDVFFDRRSLKASERFDVTLVDRLRACDVLIAVVGPNWMAMESGQPRISQRGDYVRGEIAEALGGRPIIPVLFRGANRPNPANIAASQNMSTAMNMGGVFVSACSNAFQRAICCALATCP